MIQVPAEAPAESLGVAEVQLLGRDAGNGQAGWGAALARPAGWLAAGLLLLVALELVLSEWRAASASPGEQASR